MPRNFQTYFDLLPKSIYTADTESDIAKLIKIFNNRMTSVDERIDDLYRIRDLQFLTGKNLDKTGLIVGEARESRDDETYRLFLSIAVLKNTSRGTINEINQLSQIIAGAEGGELIETATGIYNTFFDGSVNLDGGRYLRGYWHKAAQFEYKLIGELETMDVPADFSEAIVQIKATGVTGFLNSVFQNNLNTLSFLWLMSVESQILSNIYETGQLDYFDGNDLLDGQYFFRPYRVDPSSLIKMDQTSQIDTTINPMVDTFFDGIGFFDGERPLDGDNSPGVIMSSNLIIS